MIEETAHVIGKSQSMREEEGARTDEERERDEGGDGGGWGGEEEKVGQINWTQRARLAPTQTPAVD